MSMKPSFREIGFHTKIKSDPKIWSHTKISMHSVMDIQSIREQPTPVRVQVTPIQVAVCVCLGARTILLA